MKKLMISTAILVMCGLYANAQDFPVYQPAIDYSAGRKSATIQPNAERREPQIINAYATDGITRSPFKIKIKVIFGNMANSIVAYRRLSDRSWLPGSGYVNRLDVNDKLADTFEYKGYLNGMTVYF